MNKKIRKAKLNKETLRNLETDGLREVAGAFTTVVCTLACCTNLTKLCSVCCP
jgi:hypothetical protein